MSIAPDDPCMGYLSTCIIEIKSIYWYVWYHAWFRNAKSYVCPLVQTRIISIEKNSSTQVGVYIYPLPITDSHGMFGIFYLHFCLADF